MDRLRRELLGLKPWEIIFKNPERIVGNPDGSAAHVTPLGFDSDPVVQSGSDAPLAPTRAEDRLTPATMIRRAGTLKAFQ
jgi:hypothetical protein